jgi:hypothetical protein
MSRSPDIGFSQLATTMVKLCNYWSIQFRDVQGGELRGWVRMKIRGAGQGKKMRLLTDPKLSSETVQNSY